MVVCKGCRTPEKGYAMTHSMREDPAEQVLDTEMFGRLVIAYQRAQSEWRGAEPGPEKEALRERVSQAVLVLWPELAAVLRPVARQWARSHQMSAPAAESWQLAVEDATTNLCLEILDQIPRLAIRPEDNLPGLFRTIARRREIDAYRRLTRAIEERPPGGQRPDEPPADERSPRRTRVIPLDETLLQSCADLFGQEFESQIVEREYQYQLRDAILAFWRGHLSSHEALIIQERFLRDPPTAHNEIAQILGSPWTSESIRTRLHRILKRTRDHLQAINLYDEDTS